MQGISINYIIIPVIIIIIGYTAMEREHPPPTTHPSTYLGHTCACWLFGALCPWI